MNTLRYERAALASGLLYGLSQIAATAFFVATVAPHLPAFHAPAAEQLAFYSTFRDLNQLAAFFFVLPAVFLAPFVASLQAVVKRLEGDLGVLTSLTGTAGAALVMLWPIGIVVAGAGQSMAAAGLDATTVVTFDAVAQLALALSGIPRAALLLGVALALLPQPGSLRRLGFTGIALSALSLTGVATLLSETMYIAAAISALLFAVWVVVLAANLLSRPAVEHGAASQHVARLAAAQ